MNKEYFINHYEIAYNEAKEEYIQHNNGVDDGCFDFEDVNTIELIVGYYLVYYGDNALNQWLENLDGSGYQWNTDEGVSNVLAALFK
ncbi:hypothetical protein M3649_04020 [Ureibacillus chungkukjangi]|uniref:hypothetical protein n=1 Tax=Ureibacillus chungkukjangi TaxID=1202712 RepID=UPI0020401C24|nr:hypothetical protein [Ureibacillus chungkukjangi]MCM3387299.1 hypothetical protein [Ureibacillus chungkukjangi]